jgi:hypothetical protein
LKQEDEPHSTPAHMSSDSHCGGHHDLLGLCSTPSRIATTAFLGVICGLAGGMFGVGGGVILVPILTKMTGDVQTATATSLAALIPPTLVS